MTIKLKQKVYKYGSRHAWKGELAGMIFAMLITLGGGVAALAYGTFGDPKDKPGKEQPLSPRTRLLIVGAILMPVGMTIGYQAVRLVQDRHRIDENEFTLAGVTSYEVVSERDSEEPQRGEMKRAPWFSTY